MNVPFGLRRAASVVTVMSTSETDPATPPAQPSASRASGNLIDRYAHRRQTVHVLISRDQVAADRSTEPIGRGSAEHPISELADQAPAHRARRARREPKDCIKQRLIAASLVLTVSFIGTIESASAQQRYRVQPGDTLAGVADEFDVDAEAILRSSWLSNPPELTAGDVIIIPDQGQSPEDAALTAAENEGTSPWTTGAHWVEPGESIPSIAADYGVDTQDVLTLNDLSGSDIIHPGDRILIPGEGQVSSGGGGGAAAAVSETADSAAFDPAALDAYIEVPNYFQQRTLSCEYASVFIATSAFGNAIEEQVMIDAIPVTKNPHLGYRGNIDGQWGNYVDYGIYPEPLVPMLNQYGFDAEIFYNDGDPETLRNQLDAGRPVVSWLGFWGDTGQVYDDEGTYTVFAGLHVIVAFGYDDEGVYFSDPATGSNRFLDWATYTEMSATLDGMSMAVFPSS